MAIRPHVLLVDLSSDAYERLRGRGYNVDRGTLGHPFNVIKGDALSPVGLEQASLPGYTEADIVVVDFEGKLGDAIPPEWPAAGELHRFQSHRSGVLDARPLVAVAIRDGLDRVHQHGGVLCIFADEAAAVRYELAQHRDRFVGKGVVQERRLWDMLTPLGQLIVSSDFGAEIVPTTFAERLGCAELLYGRFTCTVEPGAHHTSWISLAENRWGASVAGMLVREGGEGTIVVLPQIADKAAAVDWIVEELGPLVSPKLFPERTRTAWRDALDLELAPVRELRSEVARLRSQTAEAEASLQERIDVLRTESAWLLDLLDGTDEVLVQAVKRALEVCGLRDVRDIDAELEATGSSTDRREDLQVCDRSPLLLVEVKGITRPRPQESEAMQVAKYLFPRARDLARTDIAGLAIINHERHRPPEQRADEVFGADVITSAEAQHVGLLKGVDLYRLARGVVDYGWSGEVIADRFWQSGLLDGRPTHLVSAGRVAHVFGKSQAIAIALSSELAIGDRIAVELAVYTVELDVSSLQQNGVAVVQVGPGEEVGVFVGDLVHDLRKGMEILVARPARIPRETERPPPPGTARGLRERLFSQGSNPPTASPHRIRVETPPAKGRGSAGVPPHLGSPGRLSSGRNTTSDGSM